MARLSPTARMIRCNDAPISYDDMVAKADRSALYEIVGGAGPMGVGEHDEIVGFITDGIFMASDITLRCIARAI